MMENKADPANVRATRQRGCVGLLSNRFAEAEKYLRMAITLAPDDLRLRGPLVDPAPQNPRNGQAGPRRRRTGGRRATAAVAGP